MVKHGPGADREQFRLYYEPRVVKHSSSFSGLSARPSLRRLREDNVVGAVPEIRAGVGGRAR